MNHIKTGERLRVPEIDHEQVLIEQLTHLFETGKGGYIKSEEELAAKINLFKKIRKLYLEDTQKSHEELMRILHEEGISSSSRYEEIHKNGGLKLSDFENVDANDFARRLKKQGEFGEASLILELGPGGGADSREIASAGAAIHVIAADISETAIQKNNEISEKTGYGEKIKVASLEFTRALKACQRQLIDGIYSYSTLHYWPGKVLENEIFPWIVNVLATEDGRFYLAMKLAQSDSANSPMQIAIAPDHPDNPKFDVRHGLVRIYPHSPEVIHGYLKRAGLHVRESRVVENKGYDREGESEFFCQIIAEVEKKGLDRPIAQITKYLKDKARIEILGGKEEKPSGIIAKTKRKIASKIFNWKPERNWESVKRAKAKIQSN